MEDMATRASPDLAEPVEQMRKRERIDSAALVRFAKSMKVARGRVAGTARILTR